VERACGKVCSRFATHSRLTLEGQILQLTLLGELAGVEVRLDMKRERKLIPYECSIFSKAADTKEAWEILAF